MGECCFSVSVSPVTARPPHIHAVCPMTFSTPSNFWQHPPFSGMLSVCHRPSSVRLSGSQAQPLGTGQLPEVLPGAVRNGRHTPGKKDGKWEFITLLDPQLRA